MKMKVRGFLLLLFVFGFVLSGCEKSRTPNRYLIPHGYVGWIVIQYGVPNAPPLPIENGFQLYVIPKNGQLKTSSTALFGHAYDEFFYVSSSGRRQQLETTGSAKGDMVWGGGIGEGETRNKQGKVIAKSFLTETFFIGTEQQFDKAGAAPMPMQ